MAQQEKTPAVRCLKCKRPVGPMRSNGFYWCERCRIMFDDDPNEGGDYSDRNPLARLEREERKRGGHRR